MAENLRVRVRRQIERLRKDLDAATRRVAALRKEIERHELVYEMLDGRKTGKRTQRSRPGAGALKRGSRGAMIDWRGVFGTLPDQFTLDTMSADKTAGEKSRGCLRQVIARWSKGGPNQTHWPGRLPSSCADLRLTTCQPHRRLPGRLRSLHPLRPALASSASARIQVGRS